MHATQTRLHATHQAVSTAGASVGEPAALGIPAVPPQGPATRVGQVLLESEQLT